MNREMFELVIVVHGEKKDVYLPVAKSPDKELIYWYIDEHPEIRDADYKVFDLMRSHSNG